MSVNDPLKHLPERAGFSSGCTPGEDGRDDSTAIPPWPGSCCLLYTLNWYSLTLNNRWALQYPLTYWLCIAQKYTGQGLPLPHSLWEFHTSELNNHFTLTLLSQHRELIRVWSALTLLGSYNGKLCVFRVRQVSSSLLSMATSSRNYHADQSLWSMLYVSHNNVPSKTSKLICVQKAWP